MGLSIYGLIAQINLEGFQEAAQLNTLFGVLVSLIVILFGAVLYLFKKYEDKNKDLKDLHESTAINISKIREESLEKLDEVRKEYMLKEDERNKQWRESEKEALIVLKGVNSVLELSEKMKERDMEKILSSIDLLQKSIESLKNKN